MRGAKWNLRIKFTRAWLRDTLSDYVVVGCGRKAEYRGESTPWAFRKDRFEMVSMDTFWLSSTPKIPESRYDGSDQSDCARIATAVILKPIDSAELLLFINTHTDHQGTLARKLASAQLLEYASQKGIATVITRDFNAAPDSTEIKMITANKVFPMVQVLRAPSMPSESLRAISITLTNLVISQRRSTIFSPIFLPMLTSPMRSRVSL